MALDDLKVTFLGTGTSAGIPAIGCDCRTCRSDDPRDTRLRTSGVIEFTDAEGVRRTVLIDAGPDLRYQSLRAGLTRCDAVVLTHNHVDHTWGLDELRRFNVVMESPITVYAETPTFTHLDRVYQHIFQKETNINASFVATLSRQVVVPDSTVDLFGLVVTPLRVLHGRLPILAYRFDPPSGMSADHLPLIWATDISAIPPETWPKMGGVKTLVLDMLRHRHHPTHLNLDQAISVASEIGADQTWLVHMAHEIHHSEVEASLPEGISLAWDGLVLSPS
jgi:phosphoribosyl 1,2-cyclic phosphate phosphodiesterase